MVPVYSMCAWLTYRWLDWAVYLEFIRSCFEAFVIYEFFALLLAYMGENELEQRKILLAKPKRHHLFPFCAYEFDPSKPYFLMDMKLLVLQYVVVRPLTTVFAVIMHSRGQLHPDSMNPKYGNFWFVLLNFISTSISVYALIIFFMVIYRDIQEYRPMTKFIAVKFIIFITFWQSLVIGALALAGGLPSSADWNQSTIALRLQSLLICVEMLVLSLWHMSSSCFGIGDFIPVSTASRMSGPGQTRSMHPTDPWQSLKQCFDPRETLYEIYKGFKHVFRRLLFLTKKHEPVVMLDDVDMEAMIEDVNDEEDEDLPKQ